MSADVAVLGAGVSGLSTAILALESGSSVTVYTAALPADTTSAKAGASFKPHLVEMDALPAETMRRSWEMFDAIEQGDPQAGVRRHVHWEAGSLPLVHEPFLDVVENLRVAERPEVPGGYAYGRSYTTFLIDTAVYLPWLVSRISDLGGELVHLDRPLTADDVRGLPEESVVNATGLGAANLFGDEMLRPARGQVVLVEPLPEMDWSISADGFYVYPRRDSTVIGGTAEWGTSEESADPAIVDVLLRAAQRVIPHVRDLEILETYAGLRPYRQNAVRVDAEWIFGKRVVHNYGHGGAGITLSWGTAEVAVDLLLAQG